jgi:hypothetical protein
MSTNSRQTPENKTPAIREKIENRMLSCRSLPAVREERAAHTEEIFEMKKMMLAMVVLAIVLTGAFAQEGVQFSATIDIDADLVPFTHTDVKNDEYVAPADKKDPDVLHFVQNADFGDSEIKASYTDPDQRFGGVIGLDFPGGALPANIPWGDFYGWVKPIPYIGVKAGKYTDRIVSKIGGDKDLGVFYLDVEKDGDITFNTSDSLGLGDDVFGVLLMGQYDIAGVGSLKLNAFGAPDAYHNAVTVQVATTTPNTPRRTMEIPAYYAYKAGGALGFSMDNILNLGLSYRQTHTEGSGLSLGYIYHDWGLYAVVTALEESVGLKAALGYSGRSFYEDAYKQEIREGATVVEAGVEPDAEDKAPLYTTIHFDLAWSGDILARKLSVGLYNNCSFYTLAKENTPLYDETLAAVTDMYSDESSLVLYNELVASWQLFPAVAPELRVRNYYGKISGFEGAKDKDYGKDVLLVQLLAKFTVTPNVELRAGVKFVDTLYQTPPVSIVLKNSNYVIAVPVGVTIKL